jgi:hypothetical protein
VEHPLIAIVGNASKTNNPDQAKNAAQELGAELARRECRIMVFSSDPQFIEWDVVLGFLRPKVKREPGCIEVRYPPNLDGRFLGEKDDDPLFIRTQQSGDWEASIYPSFAELDGLILIGGAYTTKIAGLLALGSRTPIVTLAGFGGAAYEVWDYLQRVRNNAAVKEDFNLMASKVWHDQSAVRLVDSLLQQRQRNLRSEKEALLGASERQRRKSLAFLAVLGTFLFILVLIALVQTLDPDLPLLTRLLLFGAPGVAGASGAAIRVLWDNWQHGETELDVRPILMTVALGFWASGVAGALFLLPQIWVVGTITALQAHKLTGFAVPVGLLAGLTLDRVFPRLIKQDVPLNTASFDQQRAQSTGAKAQRNS